MAIVVVAENLLTPSLSCRACRACEAASVASASQVLINSTGLLAQIAESYEPVCMQTPNGAYCKSGSSSNAACCPGACLALRSARVALILPASDNCALMGTGSSSQLVAGRLTWADAQLCICALCGIVYAGMYHQPVTCPMAMCCKG